MCRRTKLLSSPFTSNAIRHAHTRTFTRLVFPLHLHAALWRFSTAPLTRTIAIIVAAMQGWYLLVLTWGRGFLGVATDSQQHD
jgi:hypothetical protein